MITVKDLIDNPDRIKELEPPTRLVENVWEALGEAIDQCPITSGFYKPIPQCFNEPPRSITNHISSLVCELKEALRLQSELSRSEESILQGGIEVGQGG